MLPSVIASIAFMLSAAIMLSAPAAGAERPTARAASDVPSGPDQAAATRGLTFGIYPGGAAGAVGHPGRTAPEDPTKRLAALQLLRNPARPFVLHIYASYTGRGSLSPADQVGRDLVQYEAAGFEIELVLTYRPAGGKRDENVAGFTEFVRSAVDSFGANRHFLFLQVTNEANVRGAPAAADGAYPGAQDALIHGVIAARAEARSRGYDQLRVGFNWAYSIAASEAAFWRRLGLVGGAAFRRSLGWVGVDLYPRTWGPRIRGGLAAATRKGVLASLAALRLRYMPLARLSRKVPLHISENGYPTGPGRTEAMQVTAMTAAVSTVEANRSLYGVTDYRWFDLRDADSSSTSFESRYGVMRDDYSPKAAFAVYRKLIARAG